MNMTKNPIWRIYYYIYAHMEIIIRVSHSFIFPLVIFSPRKASQYFEYLADLQLSVPNFY